MAIRIDATELHEILALTPHTQNVLIVGRHGIGKSEIVRDFYQSRGMNVVPFFLGQMSDPGDLIGLMHKDEASGRSVFLPPYWWPRPDQPIALFLDELNRARPELLQAVQDLTLNRTLAGRALPAGSVVVAAVNEGEEYQLTDLDPALVSRFNVYTFAPTVDDWLQWATRRDLDPRVLRFIQRDPGYLESPPSSEGFGSAIEKTPDRRAWARVAALIAPMPALDKVHIKLIAGIVGAPAALAFERSLQQATTVKPEDLLLRFDRVEKRLRELPLSEVILLNEQVVHHIDAGRVADKDAERARTNLLTWLKLLHKDKKQEAVAHFTAMLESPRYGGVMAFAAESVDLMSFLVDYVRAIKV